MRTSMLALLVAFVATGCAYQTRARTYPAWHATTAAVPYQCGTARPVVVKTGKTGVGVTFVFDGAATTCALTFDDVVLTIEGREVSRATPPPLPTLAPGVRVEIYFALPFDENASYNAGERQGVLALRRGDERTTFPIELLMGVP